MSDSDDRVVPFPAPKPAPAYTPTHENLTTLLFVFANDLRERCRTMKPRR
jgi:hypothetical protein